MLLYEVSIMMEKGALTQALHTLDEALVAQSVVDVVVALEYRGVCWYCCIDDRHYSDAAE